jgi:hypothetical protein
VSLPATRMSDPVLAVTGVAAADILRRCAEARIRLAGGVPIAAEPPRDEERLEITRTTWRLVDFGEGPDLEFVHAAHRAILGRPPYEPEIARRLADLRGGRSRMEILARLALSPEGRRIGQPKVAGLVLPILVGAGRGYDRLASHPRVGDWFSRSRPHVGRVSGRGIGMARQAWLTLCTVPVLGGLLESIGVLPKLGRLQREVEELKREVQALRQDRR